MRTPVLAALLAAGLLLTATPAHADEPLICVDPGPTHIGPYVIDLPEVCLL